MLMVREDDHRVVYLSSAGLVHTPALRLTPLAASMEDPMAEEQEFSARVARLLNLAATASEAEIVAALSSPVRDGAKPDPRRFVPIEAMEAALQERGQRHQERAARKVEDAFRKGYLTTPMKAWAFDLCATDEAAFDRFIATAVPAFAHLTRESHLADNPGCAGGGRPTSPEAASVARQLGLAEDALKD
ncbi:phage protease [Rhodovulum steppense]|uniref:Mu-like prophage I protein n=1 Tax=Rhodovulum steppense TaxID=540251 RepID=A0A4R1YNG3_9RHOB|nr:phage protease [Rhodovulum steppense]TCM79649.1 Mu-like prophage I protein [Rhodovulum steppense]